MRTSPMSQPCSHARSFACKSDLRARGVQGFAMPVSCWNKLLRVLSDQHLAPTCTQPIRVNGHSQHTHSNLKLYLQVLVVQQLAAVACIAFPHCVVLHPLHGRHLNTSPRQLCQPTSALFRERPSINSRPATSVQISSRNATALSRSTQTMHPNSSRRPQAHLIAGACAKHAVDDILPLVGIAVLRDGHKVHLVSGQVVVPVLGMLHHRLVQVCTVAPSLRNDCQPFQASPTAITAEQPL